MENDDEELGAEGRLLIKRTPREEMCDALREEAEELREAVDSLTFGVHELELDEDHELYAELAKARAVMEHIAWLLDTNAIREGRSLR